MRGLICLFGAIATASAKERNIVTFDGAKGTTFKWHTVDDPVMGGQSKSTWALENKRGSWTGEVKIVSFLHAPGFCTVACEGYKGDWSSAGVDGSVSVHLRINPRNEGHPNAQNLTFFALQFDSSESQGRKKGEFACPVTVDLAAPWGVDKTITVPFSSCSQSWRGEPEGGRPTLEQLSAIERLGLSTGAYRKGKETGYAGFFDLELERLSLSPSPPPPPPSEVALVTFGKGDSTDYPWDVTNDPVMGGQSHATFRVDTGRRVGVFDGECKIVPSLKAPGFCNAEARAGFLRRMPDASATFNGGEGGLVYAYNSTGRLESFKVAFGTSSEFDFGSFKADVNLTSDGKVHKLFVPFKAFSNKWSSATGEPRVRCSAAHPEVCPHAVSLMDIGSVGIWAEGVAGEFHVELHSIGAAKSAEHVQF